LRDETQGVADACREKLTPKQEAIYNFLAEYLEEHGFPPTVREVCRRFGLRSTKAVTDHLAALERKGWIRRRREASRGIELIGRKPLVNRAVELPILGSVAAGSPSQAEQYLDGHLMLDTSLLPSGEVFLLRVRGDSMIGAHILDGDYVIVRRQSTANDGDIVAVVLGNEATVKRFLRGPDRVVLKAENPEVEDKTLVGAELAELKILGKVTGVVRCCR